MGRRRVKTAWICWKQIQNKRLDVQESALNGKNFSVEQSQPTPHIGYPDIRQVRASPVHDGKILLPGTGQKKDDDCGKWLSVAVCSFDPINHPKTPIVHSCNRLECPICYRAPLIRAAEASGQRTEGYQSAQRGQAQLLDPVMGKAILPPRHFMISPPALVVNKAVERTWRAIDEKYLHEDDWGRIFIEKFRYEAYKAARIADLDGGAVITHLYRIRKEEHRYIMDECEKRGFKDRWEFVINQSDWRDYIYWSPHVHLVAYGTAIPTGAFYDQSGEWAIRMIREASTVQGLMYYLLSHAPVINGRLSVTYLGCLSPQRLRCTKIESAREEVLCPQCGNPLVYASVDDDGVICEIHLERPLMRKKKIRYYSICPACGYRRGRS